MGRQPVLGVDARAQEVGEDIRFGEHLLALEPAPMPVSRYAPIRRPAGLWIPGRGLNA